MSYPQILKRRLQDEGQLEDDLSAEALEQYRHKYFQQPIQKVFETVANSQRAVILGDPGSGKSSLLQYLALEWVEGKTETLPLLIELREFAIDPAANFLDFLHRGRGVDWQFDQQQLHQNLLESSALVMFDGLDEVFDRTIQSTVIDDIIRFSQQYPKAQILITSRIIGYNPERFQHSGFQHFTIQSLDIEKIHEFIDRWYDLSMGSDPDKARLKQRLKAAIANSQAIANLADNPLLLTMIAILNRRQELPQDRADLYDQASRVLLYQWDIEHKRLKLPINAITRREKQEMLRLIAHEMQVGEEGLKGNLISIDRLTRILADYLRDQGFSDPREKANLLIQQLRERNFILCYRGADNYGFMHRTFLEYFCAVEIVHRFEKQRILTFEQLRDEVFEQHWRNEAWHEVLRLICGAIDPKFASELINYLIDFYEAHDTLSSLAFAATCFSEIKNRSLVSSLESKLLKHLKSVTSRIKNHLAPDGMKMWVEIIAEIWQDQPKTLEWLKTDALTGHPFLRSAAVETVAKVYKDFPDTLDWLRICAASDDPFARSSAIEQLGEVLEEEESFALSS